MHVYKNDAPGTRSIQTLKNGGYFIAEIGDASFANFLPRRLGSLTVGDKRADEWLVSVFDENFLQTQSEIRVCVLRIGEKETTEQAAIEAAAQVLERKIAAARPKERPAPSGKYVLDPDGFPVSLDEIREWSRP